MRSRSQSVNVPPPRVRESLAIATALALLLQSLVAQTHIHGTNTPWNAGLSGLIAKLASAGEADGTSSGSAKHNPPNDDSRFCPFCQAMQHAGSFVSPAAIVFLPAWQNISLVPTTVANKTRVDAGSHSWRGRAPPNSKT